MVKSLLIASLYDGSPLNELNEFLDDIYNQSFRDFDIAFYYDGPVSNQLISAIDSFSRRIFADVYILKGDQSRGLAFALNQLILFGIRRGYSYFIRFDTDDRMHKDRLKILIEEADKQKDVDAIGSNYSYFGFKNNDVILPELNDAIKRKFAYATAIAHATLLLKRSLFEKAGIYSAGFTTLIEDQRLWSSAFRNNCKFYNIQENLYYVRTSRSLVLRRLQVKTRFNLLCLKLSFCFTQLEAKYKLLCVYLIKDFLIFLVSILILPFRLIRRALAK